MGDAFVKLHIPVGTFYTYMWLREDGTPYYVGKGGGTQFLSEGRAYRKGSPPTDRILIEVHETEADAFTAERWLIAAYGRKDLGTGILRNRTDGGDGPAGWKMSEAQRKALSEYVKQHPVKRDFAEHGRRMSGAGNYWYGRTRVFDAEWRAKIAAGNTGQTRTPETCDLIRTNKKLWWVTHRPTHCIQGHLLTGDNLVVDKRGYRSCRACRKEWKRHYRQRASLSLSARSTDLGDCVPV